MSRFSSTLSDGKSRRPSGTSAMPRFSTWSAGRPPIAAPRNMIASRGAGISPAIALRSVLLPAPLAPITASTSPGPTSSATSMSAWKSPDQALRSRTTRIGSGIRLDPEIDFAHRAAGNHRTRLALAYLAAEIEDQQSIDDGEQRVHDVLDPDDRQAGPAQIGYGRDELMALMLR